MVTKANIFGQELPTVEEEDEEYIPDENADDDGGDDEDEEEKEEEEVVPKSADILSVNDLYITTVKNKKIFLNYAKNNDNITPGDLIINRDVQNANVIIENGDLYMYGDILLKKSESKDGDITTEDGSFMTQKGGFSTNGGSFSTRIGSFITDDGHFSTTKGSFGTNEGNFTTNEGDMFTNVGDFITEKGFFKTDDGNFISQKGGLRLYDGVIETKTLITSLENFDNADYPIETSTSTDHSTVKYQNLVIYSTDKKEHYDWKDIAGSKDPYYTWTDTSADSTEMTIKIPIQVSYEEVATGIWNVNNAVFWNTVHFHEKVANQDYLENVWSPASKEYAKIVMQNDWGIIEFDGLVEVMYYMTSTYKPESEGSTLQKDVITTGHADFEIYPSVWWVTYRFTLPKTLIATTYQLYLGFEGRMTVNHKEYSGAIVTYEPWFYDTDQAHHIRVNTVLQLGQGVPIEITKQRVGNTTALNTTVGYTMVNDFLCRQHIPQFNTGWFRVESDSQFHILHNLNVKATLPIRYQITWCATEGKSYPMIDMTANYSYYSVNTISPNELYFQIYAYTARNIHPNKTSSTTGYWLITLY